MRFAMAVTLAVVLVLALVIPATPEPGAAASVAATDEDDDDDEVPVKRNADSGQDATDENDGPRWRKAFRPNDPDLLHPSKRTRKPPSLRRRIGTQDISTEKVATPSELIRLIKQVSGNLSLSEWLQIHNLTLGDVLHGERGVLTALTATPAPHTTPRSTSMTSSTTTTTEATKSTIKATDILEATTINPRTRVRIPNIPRTTSRPRKLPTTSAAIMKKIAVTKAQPTQAPPQSPMAMDGMSGTALDPMMSPDQTDGHTSKPRRITADHDDQHVDVESLDITTPRLTGGLRAEIRAAAERFIHAQVFSPGQIPDKFPTRAPPFAEPEVADTKSGSAGSVTEAPSVYINRKVVGQRNANDSHNELEGSKRFMPPRRLFPFPRRNSTSRAPAQSVQLPPTRINFPLPEMIPVKTMIADAIERGALPAPSATPQPPSSTPATTLSPVVAGDEILDLLNSEESSKRLAKILESRNMTLSELLQLRERGSSQLHFSDFRPVEAKKESHSGETVVPVSLVPKTLETSESRANTNILHSFHEVPKFPFDSEEAASAGSAPAVVEAPRRSPRLLPDSVVVIPVPQEADVVADVIADEVDASDHADMGNRFQFAGARAALAVAAGVCVLAIAVFLSIFAVCRWRQRRSMRRARSAILCEQLQRGSFRGRSLSPVLVNMSKSPVPYYSTKKDLSSRATSNTASNRHYYLWRSLRKAFQEDEMQ